MARYVTTVRSAKTPREAFAYMADLRNFAEWDPGVKAVRQVEGSGGGPDAVFDVTVVAPGPDLTLRYVTEEQTCSLWPAAACSHRSTGSRSSRTAPDRSSLTTQICA